MGAPSVPGLIVSEGGVSALLSAAPRDAGLLAQDVTKGVTWRMSCQARSLETLQQLCVSGQVR